jgi:uncharacterized membrane protein
MPLSRIRRLTSAFFVVYLLAVTWPVALLVAAAEPLVLGLPLPLFWAVLWIVMSFAMLLWLDHAEQRAEVDAT